MQTTIGTRQDIPSHIAHSVFRDRGRQFVDRLGWDLCVRHDRQEVDEYDDHFSRYLIVHRLGQHVGSCRVRPVSASTMITDHFLPTFPEAADFLANQKNRVFELTRFCRAPDVSVSDSAEMLDCLALALDDFRDRYRLSGFAAVVFPHVARFLDRIGVRYITISKSRLDGKPVHLICITHAVRVRETDGAEVDDGLALCA